MYYHNTACQEVRPLSFVYCPSKVLCL